MHASTARGFCSSANRLFVLATFLLIAGSTRADVDPPGCFCLERGDGEPDICLCADGSIRDEAMAVIDVDANEIREILEAREVGWASFRRDGGLCGADDPDQPGTLLTALNRFEVQNEDLSVVPFPVDGFRDATYSGSQFDPITTECTYRAGANTQDIILSALNTGKLTVVYLPDYDGSISNVGPGGVVNLDDDDSVLYVAMDIYNGVPDEVGVPSQNDLCEALFNGSSPRYNGEAGFDLFHHALDLEIDPALSGFPDACGNGAPAFDPTDFDNILFRATPFDLDGDGNFDSIGRWEQQQFNQDTGPGDFLDQSFEEYRLSLYACAPEMSFLDFTYAGGEYFPEANFVGWFSIGLNDVESPLRVPIPARRWIRSSNSSSLVLPPGFSPDDIDLFVSTFPGKFFSESNPPATCDNCDPTLPEDFRRECACQLDDFAREENGNRMDVEFLIKHVDSLMNYQCLRSDPADVPTWCKFTEVNGEMVPDYEQHRVLFARGGVITRSDAQADGDPEDFVSQSWRVNLPPQVEVKKEVRCVGNSEWGETVDIVPGSTVEFRITTENTSQPDIALWLKDCLNDLVGPEELDFTVLPYLEASLMTAEGDTILIDASNAADYELCPLFFVPSPAVEGSFLQCTTECTRCFAGTLHGADFYNAQREPCDIVTSGDKLQFIFRVRIDAETDGCIARSAGGKSAHAPGSESSLLTEFATGSGTTGGAWRQLTDAINCITAEGWTYDPASISGNPCEPPAVLLKQTLDDPSDDPNTFTPREVLLGEDDNCVDISVLCLDIECQKEWSYIADRDADCQCTNDGECDCGPGAPEGEFIGTTAEGTQSVLPLDDLMLANQQTFPILLRLKVTGSNLSESSAPPLTLTALDPDLLDCITSTPGVSLVPAIIRSPAGGDGNNSTAAQGDDVQIVPVGEFVRAGEVVVLPGANGVIDTAPSVEDEIAQCELGQQRPGIIPGESATWYCYVYVESAAAMRALARCDDGDAAEYVNIAKVEARFTDSGLLDVCILDPAENLAAQTTCAATIEVPPPCEIQVDKKVRCVDEPGRDWLDQEVALPGESLEFRLQIENTGEVWLPRVEINDNLDCFDDWFTPGTPITAFVADCDAADPTTDGTEVDLGGFLPDGNDYCFTINDLAGNPVWLAPNQCLFIYFQVTVPEDFDTQDTPVDCTNTVTVIGHTECEPPCGNEPCEPTPETCMDGPETATIDVRVPVLECDKEACIDADGNSDCLGPNDVRFSDRPIGTPEIRLTPFRVQYCIGAKNTGEVPIADVQVCDADIFNCIAGAAGVSLFDQGAFDPVSGCADIGYLEAGTEGSSCFTIAFEADTPDNPNTPQDEFDSPWERFAECTSQGGRFCHVNTASASGVEDGAELCGAGDPISSQPCEATVCLLPNCLLDAEKQVRCLEGPDCTTEKPDDEGWMDADDLANALKVAPDACVQYRVKVTNISTENVAICDLRIDDVMNNADQFAGDPFMFEFFGPSETDPLTCDPFDESTYWDAGTYATCSLESTIAPGEMVEIRYKAKLKPLAELDFADGREPNNHVLVEGAAEVDFGNGDRECLTVYTCPDDDQAWLNPQEPSAACDYKLYSFAATTDCDNPGFMGDYTETSQMVADLSDYVFPVDMLLEIKACNDGEVPLDVTIEDTEFLTCIHNTAEITVGACDVGTVKQLNPDACGLWTCTFTIESAFAAEQLAQCDTLADPPNPDDPDFIYRNRAHVFGAILEDDPDICLPETLEFEGLSEACTADIIAPPHCDVTLEKHVRCEEGSATWGDDAEALPGKTLLFRLELCNSGPRPLPAVCLDDDLSCFSWFDAWQNNGGLISGYVAATGADDPILDGVEVDVSAFSPDDADGPGSTPDCFPLETLSGDPRFLQTNECVYVYFGVDVPPLDQLPSGPTKPTCTNTATGYGLPECDSLPDDEEVCNDNADAEFVVHLPKIDCDKDFCVEPECGTPICDSGFVENYLQCDPNNLYPFCVSYRLSGVNSSNVRLLNAAVCDPALKAAIDANPGVVVDCPLDNDGCLAVGALDPDESGSAFCRLRFADEPAWWAFARTDGGDPGEGLDDNFCYENESSAMAEVDDVCGDGGVVFSRNGDECQTTLRVAPFCNLDVQKQVRCLEGPNCTTQMAPDEGWFDADDLNQALMVAPSACVEYRIVVTNTFSGPAPKQVDIRQLKFSDVVNLPGQFEGDPFDIIVDPRLSCPIPPPFWDGTEVECPVNPALMPGETVEMRFKALLADQDTLSCATNDEPVNEITVMGAPDDAGCLNGCDIVYTCSDSDEAWLQPKCPDLECDYKQWSVHESVRCDDPIYEADFTQTSQQHLDLRDAVFPVELLLEVRADNTGETPLDARVTDDVLLDCIDANNGVSVGACEIGRAGDPNSGATKRLAVGEYGVWSCTITIDSLSAMRALADCDGTPDDLLYENLASVYGTLVSDDPNLCVPPDFEFEGDNTECDATIQAEECEISIAKDVRCEERPGDWQQEIDVLPGKTAIFRIKLCNVGETTIPQVCLADELGCIDWFDAWAASGHQASGFVALDDGSDPIGSGVEVDLSAFMPDDSLNGQMPNDCFDLRSLAGDQAWLSPAGNNPNGATQCLFVYFGVTAPTECTPGQDISCVNTADGEGLPECDGPSGDAENNCIAGPDTAAINFLCPDVECDKQVCVRPGCAGVCEDDDFVDDVLVPDPNTAYDLCVTYRLWAYNTGDVRLLDAKACDSQLYEFLNSLTQADRDQIAPNCPFGDFDANGCLPVGPLNPGESGFAMCELQFPDQDTWWDFARRDGASDADGPDDNFCYDNESTANGDVDDICGEFGVINSGDEDCNTTVRVVPFCEIGVQKQVRCLPDCQPLPPEQGWMDADDLATALKVAPTACIEYRIVITNEFAGPAPKQIDLRQVRIQDLMSAPQQFDGDPFDFIVDPRLNCVIGAPFWDNTSYECPINPPLAPGDSLTLRFRANLKDTNGLDFDDMPKNTATVDGVPDDAGCLDGVPIVYTCSDENDAYIAPQDPGLICEYKTWTVTKTVEDCATGVMMADSTQTSQKTLDLTGNTFPVELLLEIGIVNDGDVPLDVTVYDDEFLACVEQVNDAYPSSNPITVSNCQLGSTKPFILPDARRTWSCVVRIDHAEAARALAECDSFVIEPPSPGAYIYRNLPRVVGKLVSDGSGICVPPDLEFEGDTTQCTADLEMPPPCELAVTKEVRCDEPDSQFGDSAQGPPGSTFLFEIVATNVGDVDIARLCFRDMFACGDDMLATEWFRLWVDAGNSVTATLDGPGFGSPIDLGDIGFGLVEQNEPGICVVLPEFMKPQDTVTVNFGVIAPEDYDACGPDCTNQVRVNAFTECEEDAPLSCTNNDSAQVDPVVPAAGCEKTVCVLSPGTNSCVGTPTNELIIEADLPNGFTLQYFWEAQNLGETDLQTTICDEEFVQAVNGTAGVNFVGFCPLNTPNGCTTVNVPASNPPCNETSQVVSCRVAFSDPEAFENFADTGSSPIGGLGSNDCYRNVATFEALVDNVPPSSCDSIRDFRDITKCQATVCFFPTICCPPCTNNKVDVWNQNEIRFSGAERCLCSYDKLLLSNYREGADFFTVTGALQTNKAVAHFDGQDGATCCTEDPIPRPILGVVTNYIDFGNNTLREAERPLSTAGAEAGIILHRPLNDAIPLPPTDPPVLAANVQGVGAPGKRGSLLIFPDVQVTWASDGSVIKDTFIELTNDSVDDAVRVNLFLVNDRCDHTEVNFELTPSQPTFWRVSGGVPASNRVRPIERVVGDQSGLRNGGGNFGGLSFSGYVVVFAADIDGLEIKFNHLTGQALRVDYARPTAAEYPAWAFRAVGETVPGGYLIDGSGFVTHGRLLLDGYEYEAMPAKLILEYFTVGSELWSGNAGSPMISIGELQGNFWVGQKNFIDPTQTFPAPVIPDP